MAGFGSGCINKVPTQTHNTPKSSEFDASIVSQTKIAVKSLSKDDRVVLYVQCKGLASYIKHGKANTTVDLFKKLDEVQTYYGNDKVGHFPEFNTLVKQVLTQKGYNQPRQLNQYKDELILIFESFAEGCK